MPLPHHIEAEHLDEHPRGIPTAREAFTLAALWLAVFVVLPFLAGLVTRGLA